MGAPQQMLAAYGAAAATASVLLSINDSKENASTSFADQAVPPHTLTAVGNAQYSTTSPPTGLTSSGLFDGTGDSVDLPTSSDFVFGTGDFTIEAYINPAALSNMAIFSNRASVVATQFYIGQSQAGAGKLNFHTGAAIVINSATAPISAGAWTHIALTRSGNNFTLWAAGSSVGTATTALNFSSTAAFRIGRDGTAAFAPEFNGKIASVRVTKGAALYTGAFTPPSLPMTP